ncbi:MAG TPA: hypothetical protein EYP86_01460 [Candidatus Altiarchaeales archaeon]|nr:hypothetical protein [Candidatus Altiarchaeales archaeon]
MTSLTERISQLANKRAIIGITIATEEGLPVTSTLGNPDKEAASGVQLIQNRLLKSDMKFLTVADERCMRIHYYDGKFYYIIRSKRPIDASLIEEFRGVVDSGIEEIEKGRKKREIERKGREEERRKRELERRKRGKK